MEWFYATPDKTQAGPVDEATLDALFRAGTLTLDTLVWKPGMEGWQSYRMARGGNVPPGGPGIPGSVVPAPSAPAPSASAPADPHALWARVQSRGHDFTVNSVLSRSWALYAGNFWPSLGVTLLGYLIICASQTLPVLNSLLVFLVQPQMLAGIGWYFLKQFRGELVTLNDSFEGFRRGFWHQAVYMLIVTGVILALVLFVAAVIVIIPPVVFQSEATQSMVPLMLCLLIVGLPALLIGWYLVLSWLFTPLLILDKGLSALQAMKLSWQVVHQRFWKILGLFSVLSLIGLASLLVCGVGIFVMLPFGFAAVSCLYEDIFGESGQSLAP